MPALNVMIKPASGLCNMRCTYCFYTDEVNHRKMGNLGIMSPETLENVIRKSLEFAEGVCTFAFQGGEPTLAGLAYFERAVELEKKYNRHSVVIQNALQTNGYLLDEEWCRFLGENHFLVGLSIDGIRCTHDSCRKDKQGEGTFSRVFSSAQMLKDHRVDFNVLTVVNKKTAPRIHRIYQQYQKWGFSFQQYIACLDALDSSAQKEAYGLEPELYGQFLIELFELWYADYQKGTQPYIRQFENYIAILMGGYPDACEQNGVCGLQNVVEADGSVYPCDFYVLDGYSIGNLNEDSFGEIYEKRAASGFVERSQNQSGQCKDCRYYSVCRGGCRRNRVEEAGGGAVNCFCRSYQMFFDRCYDRLCLIAEQLSHRY
ncbi:MULTISPECIES: anaerobic sulfatase maturase [Blautia]|uniref:anaerobic sulfatase maturase n=1 Tax=Blautia TaxID=572511 RepID=UPI000BA3252B|nr:MULTISPECIES: anaerobic sulfatase maturase [Blautia]